jgi:hypothetical protein
MNMSRRPVKTFKSRAALSISVSVWPSDKGGYSISFQKRIKQDDGYKEVKSLFENEALVLAHLLQQAVAWIDAASQADYEARRGGGVTANALDSLPANMAAYGRADASPVDDSDIPF